MKDKSLLELIKSLSWLLPCLFIFFMFMTFSIMAGGDALNGRIEDGHYYLRRYAHGDQGEVLFKEVSFLVYVISASLYFLGCIGLFLVVKRLQKIMSLGATQSSRPVGALFNLIFGIGFGGIALYSLFTIACAIKEFIH